MRGSLCQYRLSGIELLKYSQRQYCSPQGHQKQKFPSISELDAPSLWVVAFSPGKMTLQAFCSCSPHAMGTGGAERGGQGAVGCHQPSGSPWDTNEGVWDSGDSMELMSSLCPRGGVREPSTVETAQQALLVSCVCTAPGAAGFSENLPSLFVFPVRHTWVYTSSFFLGTSCYLLMWYYHYHCFAKQTFQNGSKWTMQLYAEKWERVGILGLEWWCACEVLAVFCSEGLPFLASHLKHLLKWLFDHQCDTWVQAVRSLLFPWSDLLVQFGIISFILGEKQDLGRRVFNLALLCMSVFCLRGGIPIFLIPCQNEEKFSLVTYAFASVCWIEAVEGGNGSILRGVCVLFSRMSQFACLPLLRRWSGLVGRMAGSGWTAWQHLEYYCECSSPRWECWQRLLLHNSVTPSSPQELTASLSCWLQALDQRHFLMGNSPQFWQWGYTSLVMLCHSCRWLITEIQCAVLVDWKNSGFKSILSTSRQAITASDSIGPGFLIILNFMLQKPG